MNRNYSSVHTSGLPNVAQLIHEFTPIPDGPPSSAGRRSRTPTRQYVENRFILVDVQEVKAILRDNDYVLVHLAPKSPEFPRSQPQRGWYQPSVHHAIPGKLLSPVSLRNRVRYYGILQHPDNASERDDEKWRR